MRVLCICSDDSYSTKCPVHSLAFYQLLLSLQRLAQQVDLHWLRVFFSSAAHRC